MSQKRTYRTFTHKEAVLRICCENFDAVTAEIVRQRGILEDYIKRHADFRRSLEPLELLPGAPEVTECMARAALLAGLWPPSPERWPSLPHRPDSRPAPPRLSSRTAETSI